MTIGQTLNRVAAELGAYSDSVSLYTGQQHEIKADWLPFTLSWRNETVGKVAETAKTLGLSAP